MIGLALIIFLATFLTFNQEYLTSFTAAFKPSSSPRVNTNQAKQTKMLKITAPDGGVKAQIEVEVADTKEKRSKGLGFRQSLATTSGMFFIHESPQKYTYWMKGMEFPIDIIWISGDTISDIIPNIPPPVKGQTDETLERYSSTVDVDKVLETNAGFVISNNILKGDKIILE